MKKSSKASDLTKVEVPIDISNVVCPLIKRTMILQVCSFRVENANNMYLSGLESNFDDSFKREFNNTLKEQGESFVVVGVNYKMTQIQTPDANLPGFYTDLTFETSFKDNFGNYSNFFYIASPGVVYKIDMIEV